MMPVSRRCALSCVFIPVVAVLIVAFSETVMLEEARWFGAAVLTPKPAPSKNATPWPERTVKAPQRLPQQRQQPVVADEMVMPVIPALDLGCCGRNWTEDFESASQRRTIGPNSDSTTVVRLYNLSLTAASQEEDSAAAHVLTFLLRAVPGAEQPCNNFFYIAVYSASALVLPRSVEVQPAGDIRVRCHLADPGTYRVHVSPEWLAWPAAGRCEQWPVAGRRSGAPRVVVEGPPIVVPSAPERLPVGVAAKRSGGPQPQQWPLCSAAGAFVGRWRRDAAVEASNSSASGVVDPDTGALTPDSARQMRWRPLGCTLRSVGAAAPHLDGKHLIMLGDSTVEVLFKWVLEALAGAGAFSPENNDPAMAKGNCAWASRNLMENSRRLRWFSWDARRRGQLPGAGAARASFLYDGVIDPCAVNCEGVVDPRHGGFPWRGSAFHAQLERLVEESAAACQQLVLLFSSGIHDLCAAGFTFERYHTSLHRGFAALKRLLAKAAAAASASSSCNSSSVLEPRLLFLSTQPKFKARCRCALSASLCYQSHPFLPPARIAAPRTINAFRR